MTDAIELNISLFNFFLLFSRLSRAWRHFLLTFFFFVCETTNKQKMAPRKDKREKRRGEKRSKVMEKPDLMKKIKKISKIHRAAFRELRSRPQEISVTHQHQQIISRIAEKKRFFKTSSHIYITRRGSARSSAIYL